MAPGPGKKETKDKAVFTHDRSKEKGRGKGRDASVPSKPATTKTPAKPTTRKTR